jgi:hypothetical protein
MNLTFNLNAEQKCDKIYGLEKKCVKEYYVPECIEYRKRNSYFIFEVKHTLYPILTIKRSPKIKFEEFMCFITSIISLWFGFSVIMLSNVYSLVVKKFLLIVNN